MEKTFDAGLKLFFDILIICIISYICFKIVPIGGFMVFIGILICISYFGIYFYTGYKYNLKISQSLIVGIIGCGVGIFLSCFAIYTYFILQSPDTALWIVMPYLLPTTPIINLFNNNINILYLFNVMFINILLVVFGASVRKIINKLNS